MSARAGLIAVVAAASLTPPAAHAGSITEFPLSGPTLAGASHIAVNPLADVTDPLWFTAAERVAGIRPPGEIHPFPVPTAGSEPRGIAAGPDGAMWFTEAAQGASKIGRIDPGFGSVTEFSTPTAGSQPTSIIAGPDGALWFTENQTGVSQIGRITTAGAITEFPAGPSSGPNEIAAGPDGALWFTEGFANKIGRMTTSGALTEFPVPSPGTRPTGIVNGPDGNLWFTEFSGNRIARITPAGAVTEFPLPTADSAPDLITRGPDGALWFTEYDAGQVGRITTAGAITEHQLPDRTSGPLGIAAGPDNNMWITENRGNKIGRFDPADPPGARPPVLGKTMDGEATSGRVLVRLPGSNKFVPLKVAFSLPVGTIVDARKGRIRITASSGVRTYSAEFYEGRFQIGQSRRKGSPADIRLFGGSFRRCPAGLRNPRPFASKAPKGVRHLWGKGGGRFRTFGRFSAATVRGTTWLTTDTCSGTLTRVTQGSVAVRDFVRRRTVVVRKGRSYLAAARR